MTTIKTWQERQSDKFGPWSAKYMLEEIHELRAVNKRLRAAAQAVIDRWDTPHWKAVPATAEYIGRLRAALGEKS